MPRDTQTSNIIKFNENAEACVDYYYLPHSFTIKKQSYKGTNVTSSRNKIREKI